MVVRLDIIKKYVEYLDKNEATRIGRVKRVYGGKATIVCGHLRHPLRCDRVPLKNIKKIKMGKIWIAFP